MNNKKEDTLYLCDVNKNKECKKRYCHINGGECKMTTDKKFSKEKENEY